MSQQVQVDYEQIAIQCNSVCEVAEARLKELDELLRQSEEASSKLMTPEAKRLAESIKAERQALEENIKAVRKKADEEAQMGVVDMNNHDQRYAHREDAIRSAKELQAKADDLASGRIIQFRELLTEILGAKIAESNRKMAANANGTVMLSEEVQTLLNGIEDAVLRQFVYIAYLKDSTLLGERLIAEGKHLMNGTYESRLEEEKARIRAELEAARLDGETIEKIMAESQGTAQEQVATIRSAATAEIVGEKVRKKSLKIIMQAIEARGFIVDKRNIRIQRDTNEVVLIALKASGEKAEFRVFLDGRFVYDFHGYQGQACQKDIEPFLRDLEEVYGVKIKASQEIWSNPDKIATMKYQTFNTNKNKR